MQTDLESGDGIFHFRALCAVAIDRAMRLAIKACCWLCLRDRS